MRKELTVIIPAFNEEKIIVKNTLKLLKFLRKIGREFEIIISDNGSYDRTLELSKRLEKKFPEVRVISSKQRGVGLAFKKAVLASSSENLICMDADLSVDLNFIPTCLKLLEEGYSMVIGSKKTGMQLRKLYRLILSTGYIFLVRIFSGLRYSDYSNGAKGYRKSSIFRIVKNLDNGSFYVVQLAYYLDKRKKVVEIPVFCLDRRKSKFNLFHETFYRLRKLFTLIFLERILKSNQLNPT